MNQLRAGLRSFPGPGLSWAGHILTCFAGTWFHGRATYCVCSSDYDDDDDDDDDDYF